MHCELDRALSEGTHIVVRLILPKELTLLMGLCLMDDSVAWGGGGEVSSLLLSPDL